MADLQVRQTFIGQTSSVSPNASRLVLMPEKLTGYRSGRAGQSNHSSQTAIGLSGNPQRR